METLSIRIKYRPLRIGWCLMDGDFAGLRDAFRLTHTMWGGRFNPIIPVEDFEHGKQLVTLFRVDVLIPMSQDENVKTFIEKFPYLPSPFIPQKLHIREEETKIKGQVSTINNNLSKVAA